MEAPVASLSWERSSRQPVCSLIVRTRLLYVFVFVFLSISINPAIHFALIVVNLEREIKNGWSPILLDGWPTIFSNRFYLFFIGIYLLKTNVTGWQPIVCSAPPLKKNGIVGLIAYWHRITLDIDININVCIILCVCVCVIRREHVATMSASGYIITVTCAIQNAAHCQT